MVIRTTNRTVKSFPVVEMGETAKNLRPFLQVSENEYIPYLGTACKITHVGNGHSITDIKAEKTGLDMDLSMSPLDPITR